MSGIFGIYVLSGQSINPSHLEGMAEGSAHRGPDGTRLFSHAHIGLGHTMLHTTPESLSELLPYTDPESGIVITADARIDNRDELFNKLNIERHSTIPDSHLILETIKHWGVEGINNLLGDFAFALWNPSNKQLICARDYIGVKPLYFHSSSKQFLFSSEIKQIAEHPDIILQPNEGIIGEYLNASLCSQTETLYQGINRLGPGQFLIVSPHKMVINKFWVPHSIPPIRYKTSRQYSEHFFEIFQKATKSRLRGNTPVSAELSGGLDSSSVLGMACNLCDIQHIQKPTIYSMVFPGHPFDEISYIKAAAKQFDEPVHFIQSLDTTVANWDSQIRTSFELPPTPNLSIRNQLTREISSGNSRILLSGIGGDEWLSGANYPYLDLFLDKKLTYLLNEIKNNFSRKGTTVAKQMVLSYTWPLIPHSLKKLLCQPSNGNFPEWLPSDFASNIKLLQRIQHSDPRTYLSNLGHLSAIDVTSNGFESYFLEALDRYHAPLHLEYRMPFLDKRIAEFTLAIPAYELQRSGNNKVLLRNSTNRFIPASLRKRQDKPDFSYFINRAFSTDRFNAAINSLTIANNNWIERDSFRKHFHLKQQLFNSDNYHVGNLTWETWFTGALEMWFQNIFIKK